jgi:transposase
MSEKHTIDEQRVGENESKQGIIVPLDLPEFEILSQSLGPGESIEVQVRAKKESAVCPRCGEESSKVHDTRKRIKRDIQLGAYQVSLVVHKRRFRCARCEGKPFTESDSACGHYQRTTKRFRDHIAKQASSRPITHVAQEVQVGPRFVHDCLVAWIEEKLKKKGRTLDEQTKLPTPQILGIDEFALRKGHHYDTILCDLESRDVLEVGEGRKKEDVIELLDRLSHPESVKAVSMDMSASFRPAVQEALPMAQIVVDHFHVIQHIMKAFEPRGFQLGAQKGGHGASPQEAVPLFKRIREFGAGRKAGAGKDWGSTPTSGESMAVERSITRMVCHSHCGRCS